MRITGENDSLSATFKASDIKPQFAQLAVALLTPSPSDHVPDYIVHAMITSQEARLEQDDKEHAQKSGNRESIQKTGAAAAKDKQDSLHEEAERKDKQRADDALFLGLLQSGDLDGYVARHVFGGMDDVQIAEVIAEIEAATGQSFEDYARGILGELPERRDGESDAEYNRRVLTAVADEILNDDLTFKLGFENDPVARIIRDHTEYLNAKAFVERTNAQVLAEAAPSSDVSQAVADVASESYETGDELGDGLVNEELGGTSRDVQDGSRDSELQKVTDNPGGFGAALAMASNTFGSEFENSAAKPDEVGDASAEPNTTIRPTTPG